MLLKYTTKKQVSMEAGPCIFCESEELILDDVNDGADGYEPFYHVVCDECGATGPSDNSAEIAIELWNKAHNKHESKKEIFINIDCLNETVEE